MLSDESCYWTLRLLKDCPSPDEVLDACVSVYKAEYDEIDVSNEEGRVSGMNAVCQELEFFCVDLPVNVSLTCVETSEFTALVLWQALAEELVTVRPMFDHMTQSLQLPS